MECYVFSFSRFQVVLFADGHFSGVTSLGIFVGPFDPVSDTHIYLQ